ncbi:hypothetical protein [Nocardioides terrisoli]|uniref:hypothetical protein n=1 Tax=Nocardioides terrisoli TaxID=3388267 RepID=UPI00287B5C99|nr:hypothetical protein [Nocardioides marmorisolisilvae]
MSTDTTPPPPSPEGDPLARQLLSHAQMISRLRRDLDELAHEAVDTAAGLAARIDDLETTGNTSSIAASSTAWCWRNLGPKGRDELWRQLTDWVGWLRARYPLARTIPTCWAEHPEVVEELTALWLAWQQAYEDNDPPLTAAADWHDRWLPGVLHRLQHGAFAIECSTQHRPRPAASYGPPTPDLGPDADLDPELASAGAGPSAPRAGA